MSPHSVVIKVGMVGDSQIGKTSLMVKYVEGSFDEDYIQTLGAFFYPPPYTCANLQQTSRCQLHGEDHYCATYDHYLLNLGPWRTA